MSNTLEVPGAERISEAENPIVRLINQRIAERDAEQAAREELLAGMGEERAERALRFEAQLQKYMSQQHKAFIKTLVRLAGSPRLIHRIGRTIVRAARRVIASRTASTRRTPTRLALGSAVPDRPRPRRRRGSGEALYSVPNNRDSQRVRP